MFRFLTAGESHGPCLTVIVEGIPAGMPFDVATVNEQLRRRQGGYGRGGRMKIERDEIDVLSGVRHGHTMGAPITLRITNRDWVNWRERMSAAPVEAEIEPVTRVRPGHADLTGALKYGHDDVREVIERASSRETAARVAVGGVCRQLLAQFGVSIHSHVLAVAEVGYPAGEQPEAGVADAAFWERVAASEMYCADDALTQRMIARILAGKRDGDTCGGVFEVVATGVPVGLGSYSQWDRRLSARIAQALMSIPSAKGVEIGGGFGLAALPGSQVHDVVRYDPAAAGQGWYHVTNHAGGIEGGISNGEPIIARVAVKPIPTLAHPLPAADVRTGENVDVSRYERSDVCVVPAAGVVGEAMLAIALADAWLEKFGGDSLSETRRNVAGYLASLRREPADVGGADLAPDEE
ncbi:MAG: chorismate synthase [Chloroflexota bacterium]|nr:chorismate synthase [Chloroflexota bacterium]